MRSTGSPRDAGPSDLRVGASMELTAGAVAAGGGCVARAPDGRVVFVRHALPGELVVAELTAVTTKFLRADAVKIVRRSPDRVDAPCPHAGPGRCGGCDWQHIALPAQRALKAELVAEQLRRVAGIDVDVHIEEVAGAPDGLGWRTRVQFSVDRSGRAGFRRHRSHVVVPVDSCPIAFPAVNAVGAPSRRWPGAQRLEVTASPGGGAPVVAVESGRNRVDAVAVTGTGLVVNGLTVRKPARVRFTVGNYRFWVSPGVFWQVHPGAAGVLVGSVLEALSPEPGQRVADLFAGAGLFAVPLADAVGPGGAVVAVERSAAACADAVRNAGDRHQVSVLRSEVDAGVVADHLGRPQLVVLDPGRQGAGPPVMAALAALDPPPVRIAYVSCDAASFARDVRVMVDAGWTMRSLRGFDLFPMTEHVELLAVLEPPGSSG